MTDTRQEFAFIVTVKASDKETATASLSAALSNVYRDVGFSFEPHRTYPDDPATICGACGEPLGADDDGDPVCENEICERYPG